MFRSTFLTILLFLASASFLWSQDDKQKPRPLIQDEQQDLTTSDIAKYGLIHKEPVQKVPPDSMPILNPKEYDAKIQLWSPPFEWFNSMPVIPGPEKKADSLNYWWKPNSTQKESKQHE